jgi:hypothetical protein
MPFMEIDRLAPLGVCVCVCVCCARVCGPSSNKCVCVCVCVYSCVCIEGAGIQVSCVYVLWNGAGIGECVGREDEREEQGGQGP